MKKIVLLIIMLFSFSINIYAYPYLEFDSYTEYFDLSGSNDINYENVKNINLDDFLYPFTQYYPSFKHRTTIYYRAIDYYGTTFAGDSVYYYSNLSEDRVELHIYRKNGVIDKVKYDDLKLNNEYSDLGFYKSGYIIDFGFCNDYYYVYENEYDNCRDSEYYSYDSTVNKSIINFKVTNIDTLESRIISREFDGIVSLDNYDYEKIAENAWINIYNDLNDYNSWVVHDGYLSVEQLINESDTANYFIMDENISYFEEINNNIRNFTPTTEGYSQDIADSTYNVTPMLLKLEDPNNKKQYDLIITNSSDYRCYNDWCLAQFLYPELLIYYNGEMIDSYKNIRSNINGILFPININDYVLHSYDPYTSHGYTFNEVILNNSSQIIFLARKQTGKGGASPIVASLTYNIKWTYEIDVKVETVEAVNPKTGVNSYLIVIPILLVGIISIIIIVKRKRSL